jgi:uncharacterized membrane protein
MSSNITPMKTDFDQFENDRMIADPTNYKWGIFYFNRKDSRIVVPKRVSAMGWTLNFGKIYTYILLIFIIVAGILFSKAYR